MQVFGFVGFQTAGRLLETRVVDNMAEPFQPDFSLANVFMPVHPRTEVSF